MDLPPVDGYEGLGPLHACVDAGRLSPRVLLRGKPAAHPWRPYFYAPRSLLNEMHACAITLYDQPNAVVHSAIAFLEAAVICLNHEESGRDKVLRDWIYSYAGWGAVHAPPQERSTVTEAFKAIVEHDYPDYVPHIDW
jgi:hypothetical protein